MASRSLGTLTLDLIARIGGFEQGMDKAARSADKNLSAIEKRAYQFGNLLGQSLKAAGVAAVAGLTGLAVALKSTINGLDDLSKSAQKVGTTTEELSKLAYAGELADVSLETLTGSLGKLTKAQAEALDASSETAKIFKALGIEVTGADGKLRASTDVLGDFAEVFQQLKGSPEAMAAGFKIFGRSFQDLVPLLKDGKEGIAAAGAELESFGGVISTEAGKNAEDFNDNLTRLKTQFTAILSQIAGQLLPTLVDLSEDLSRVAKEGNLAANAVVVISTAMRVGVGLIDFYNGAVDRLAIAFELANRAGEGYLETQRNILSLGFAEGSVAGGLGKIGDAASDAQARLDALAAAQDKVQADFSGVRGTVSSTAKTPEEAAAAAAEARLKKLLAALSSHGTETKKTTKELSEAEKAWKDLEETYAAIEEETSRFTTDRVIEQGNLSEARRKATQDLLDDLTAEQASLGQTAEQQEILNNLRWAGVDASSEEGKAIIAKTEQLQKERAIVNDQIQAMDGLRDAWRGFANDLKDGVGIWDALKKGIDSFADTLFQIAAQNIGESLFGPQGAGAGGSTAGAFSQILGAFFGGGRANGGPVGAGGVYEVNERGRPELLTVGGRDYLMMGHQSGQVTPTAGGGGITLVNHFNYAAPYDARTEEQRNGRLAFETKRAAQRNG